MSKSAGKQKANGKHGKQGQYPFWLGGLAASLAACLTHPLDVAKVRMQTGGHSGMFGTLVGAVKEQGLRRGAYTGLSASLLRQMTYSLTRFGVYDHLKEQLGGSDGNPLPAWKMAIAASIAGGIGGLAGNPADIILVRMVGDVNKPPDQRSGYRHCFEGLSRIVTNEGAAALFRGLGPNVTRAVLMNASQLATYDTFKHTLISTGYFDEGLWLHFNASFLAGTVATTICSPFDVVKSRIMNASQKATVLQVVRTSFKQDGLGWMFKGWTPAWIRLGPNTVAIFLILEQLRKVVDSMRA